MTDEPMQSGGVKENPQGSFVCSLWNENKNKMMADCLTNNVEAIEI